MHCWAASQRGAAAEGAGEREGEEPGADGAEQPLSELCELTMRQCSTWGGYFHCNHVYHACVCPPVPPVPVQWGPVLRPLLFPRSGPEAPGQWHPSAAAKGQGWHLTIILLTFTTTVKWPSSYPWFKSEVLIVGMWFFCQSERCSCCLCSVTSPLCSVRVHFRGT